MINVTSIRNRAGKMIFTAWHPLLGSVLTTGAGRSELCRALVKMGFGHWWLLMPGAPLSILIADHQ